MRTLTSGQGEIQKDNKHTENNENAENGGQIEPT